MTVLMSFVPIFSVMSLLYYGIYFNIKSYRSTFETEGDLYSPPTLAMRCFRGRFICDFLAKKGCCD
jgi:hypothetical protein